MDIIISSNVTCSNHDIAGKIADLVLNNNQSLTKWSLNLVQYDVLTSVINQLRRLSKIDINPFIPGICSCDQTNVGCDPSWYATDTQCYYIETSKSVTRDQASIDCGNKQANLFRFSDPKELVILFC